MTKAAMAKAVVKTCAANKIRDGYIRLVVTRGVGTLGAGVVTAEQVRADVHHCTITHVRNKWTHCPVVCIINRTLCPL